MNFYELAIKNISKYGDTDIFPYPIENLLFQDKSKDIEQLLVDIDKHFDEWLSKYPITTIKACIPVGYTGFRWATLIDPIWNAYLLSQVLKVSEKIENSRISTDKKSVFSYRINLDKDSGKIFNMDFNWRAFYQTAIELAKDYSYVVRFDISDFYNRIYHHRLENSLHRVQADKDTTKKIMKILQDISVNVSYGLPIGGNASRILAEVLLNSMDQMMNNKQIRFCRFVDDYIIFANSKEDAFRNLNWCAEFLLKNEGLALQKNKTQVQTVSEFLSHAKASLEGEEGESNVKKTSFLRLHIHYDPYSSTAEDDYIDLKNKLAQFDIVSLIRSEVRKSKIHQAFGKQLLSAIHHLESDKLSLAFNVISSNLEIFYPIFPSVMQLACRKLLDCDTNTIDLFIETICNLVTNDSYLIQTDNNASYVARVLSLVPAEKTVQAVTQLNERQSELIRTNCLYSMTNLNNSYWLSDVKTKFSTLTRWERRAFIASSFFLGDEGKHWREKTKEQFSSLEKLLSDWISSKHPVQNSWKLPL